MRLRHLPRLLPALGLSLVVACGGDDPGRPAVPGDSGPIRPAGVEAADSQSVTGGVNASPWTGAPYVVLLSLDAFGSEYMQRYAPPALTALAAEGVWATDGMVPVFPTLTFPSHYALATGLYPAHNGIVGNTFYDPARGEVYSLGDVDAVQDGSWYRGEPLWVTAERQGMVAASFYWVGSEAAIGGVRPSYWREFDASVPNEARMDQVVQWLAYPSEYRPHLVTAYISTIDGVGHGYGPHSPEMAAAVAEVDAAVARLVAGIDALPHGDQVTLVVVADHGMDGYAAQNTRYLEDVVDLEGVFVPESGPSARVHVEGGRAAARALRDAVNQGLDGVRAYLADETPERLHYRGDPRLGDVVLIADSGHVVYPVADRPARDGWTHGWDNALLSMRALFVARGPRLVPGSEVEPFALVHVYPLVTRLLGLQAPADIDGSPSFWDAVLGG